MCIDVSDKWMKCYNVYKDFDLCKGIIDELNVYETDDKYYGHRFDEDRSVDTSMGKWYSGDAQIYEIEEDGLAYYSYYGYGFSYYPDINGICVSIGDCDYDYAIMLTLQ